MEDTENFDNVNDNELKIKLRNRRERMNFLMKNSDSNTIFNETETPIRDSITSTTSAASSSSSSSTSASTSTESEKLSTKFRRYLNDRTQQYHKNENENLSRRISIQRLLSMRRKKLQRNNQNQKYPNVTYVGKLTRKFEKLAHNYTDTATPVTLSNTKDRNGNHEYSRSSGNSLFYVNVNNSINVNNEENHIKIMMNPLSESSSSSTSTSTIITEKKFHSKKNNYKILRESGKSNENFWKENNEKRESDKSEGEEKREFDDEEYESSITSTSSTTTTTTDEYYETCDMSDEVEKQNQQIENSLQSNDIVTFDSNQKDQFKNDSEINKNLVENDSLNELKNIPGIFVEEFSDYVNRDQQQQLSNLGGGDLNDGDRSNFDKFSYQFKNDQKTISGNKRQSDPIPKSNLDDICEATNRHIVSKSLSCYPSDSDDDSDFENSYSLTSSKLSLVYESKDIPPIIEELIMTERKYIKNLKIGIQNYGRIFNKMNSVNLPMGLKGKKWILLGNIEQIYEFHDIEFLPMLLRNQYNLKDLFDEFMKFINENCFYSYILYTMNKKRSLKLCEKYRQYFKDIQEEIGDKLGINSFLVQPIQRLARYPLLLQQFIMTCFKTGNIKYKPIIESCCKVEKRVRNLLITTNEAEEINDIEECYEINILHQGKFKKVNEFTIYDYTQRRSYRSKVFIFDKCLLYTEIRDKRLIYRGYYPCNLIGFIAKHKSFTLYYHKQKCQECEFTADKQILDQWIDLIRDMINVFAEEEKLKLKERYTSKKCDIYRRSSNVLLLRNPNRLSTDSSTGSVFSNGSSASTSSSSSLSVTSVSLPSVTNSSEEISPRTTWYDNS